MLTKNKFKRFEFATLSYFQYKFNLISIPDTFVAPEFGTQWHLAKLCKLIKHKYLLALSEAFSFLTNTVRNNIS